MKKLHSNFAIAIEELIEQKRGLGYKFESQAYILSRFDAFCADKFPCSVILDKNLVTTWATLRKGENPGTLESRVSPVNELAKYFHRKGIEAYSLPKGFMPKKVRYIPYIFSDEELERLFETIDTSCGFCYEVPLRHWVMPVFFRLLYCCGLRVSEARLLQIKDVDLTRGVLTLTHTKNNKQRQIPLHPHLQTQMKDYFFKVHTLSNQEDWFFPGLHNNPMTVGNVNRNFRRFLWSAHISHSGRTPIGKKGAPNVHSLRHTFAVNCLRKWMRQSKNLHAYLPVLQEFMGHTQLCATEYYLHFSVDMIEDIRGSLEERLGTIIPNNKFNRNYEEHD